MWDALGYFLTGLLLLTSIFLVLLVLVQRGKGGGLVGALGGMGGQSAFGAKAGGIFWATSLAAGFWILLCIVTVKYNSTGNKVFAGASGANANTLNNAPSSVEPVADPSKPGATGTTNVPTAPGNSTSAPGPTGKGTTGEVSSPKDFEDTAPATGDEPKP